MKLQEIFTRLGSSECIEACGVEMISNMTVLLVKIIAVQRGTEMYSCYNDIFGDDADTFNIHFGSLGGEHKKTLRYIRICINFTATIDDVDAYTTMYELGAYGDAPIVCKHKQVTACGDVRLDVTMKLGDDNSNISDMAKRALIGFDLFECNAMKAHPAGISVDDDRISSEIVFPTIIHIEQLPDCDASDDSVTKVLKERHARALNTNS